MRRETPRYQREAREEWGVEEEEGLASDDTERGDAARGPPENEGQGETRLWEIK